jgi:excisionase family DNA binding protein
MSGKKPGELEQFYTVRQVAELWNVSERTVWRVIAGGELEVYRINKAVRITGNAARRYLEQARG